MAVTEVMPGVRYVVGAGSSGRFATGEVVTLSPGYSTVPDGDNEVRMVSDARGSGWVNIARLTPEAEVEAATEPRKLQVGDKVKLKAQQESALPGTLSAYLDGRDRDTAVFTISDIIDGRRDALVEFAEFDTNGGYYLRRFELFEAAPEVAADGAAPAAEQLVDVLDVADLTVGDILQVKDSIPAGAYILAGTRLRVDSVSGPYSVHVTRLDTGGSRTVSHSQLRYVSKVVTTDTTAVAGEPSAPAEPVKPVVGGKVRFLSTYVQGASAAVGDEFEITRVNEAGTVIETTNPHGPSGRWSFRVSNGDLEILPPPPVITADHEADMAKIAAALLSEATSRGARWTGVYDQLVATLNPQLTVKLPERERSITVDLGPVLGRVTLTATDEAEAKAKVLEALKTAMSVLGGDVPTAPAPTRMHSIFVV